MCGMSNEDIAAELSATFDLGLLVTREIATWIIEYREQLKTENKALFDLMLDQQWTPDEIRDALKESGK